jgi:pimeloyl-[acyl-carrier protein] methyl ester esterase
MQPPSIVLLPGLDGTGRLFAPLLSHLPSDIRPIIVSYPFERLGYQDLLRTVLAALPHDEPFVILGESFSGPLAVLAAAHQPRGLAGIVLDATFVKNPTPLSASLARPLVRPFLVRLLPSTLTARLLLGGGAAPVVAREVASVVDAVPPEIVAFRIVEALGVDVSEQLRQLQLPILYLRGRRDHFVVPGRNAREVARLGRQVEIAQFDTGHMILQTRPEESAAAIAGFCRRLTSRVPSN